MRQSEFPKIVILCGPTATGKTGFSLDLAEAVGGEIIGADSLQVYRRLDIGTAKASPQERARVPHHLIDILDPDETFNVARYKEAADQAIRDVTARGRIPIVVGGTGLYIRILVRGIFQAPQPDDELRVRLRAEIDMYGKEYLYKRLRLVDPVLAEKVAPNDTNRIMRGLEIYEQTGIALSEHQQVHDFGEPSYQVMKIGVTLERNLLYQRIEERTQKMIRDGLLDEYKGLLTRGYSPTFKPLLSLGYKQMGEHVAGRLSLDAAVADIIRETKRYAKRQFTWFRAEPGIRWVEAPGRKADLIGADVKRFLASEPLLHDWCDEAP